MKEKFSMGSKREGAKELEINITKPKLVVFLLLLLGLAYIASVSLEDNVKEAFGDEFIIGCLNGTTEVVEYGKEYYCESHYTVLQGKVSNYDRLVEIIKGDSPNE